MGTHEHITTTHSALCKMYPVAYPHGCDTGSMERQHLESHMTRCPLALVRCTFPGCAEAMKRRDVAAHEENTQRHLSRLSSAMAKVALSFEEKEVRQASLHRQEMESIRDRIRQLKQRVSDQSLLTSSWQTMTGTVVMETGGAAPPSGHTSQGTPCTWH